MMNWEKSEKKAFEWFKNNYDNDAVYQGHNNSTISDIYSPLYNHRVFCRSKQEQPKKRFLRESYLLRPKG